MVQCRVGGKPTGKGLVNHPNLKQGAEERLRGEAIEAESGKKPRNARSGGRPILS